MSLPQFPCLPTGSPSCLDWSNETKGGCQPHGACDQQTLTALCAAAGPHYGGGGQRARKGSLVLSSQTGWHHKRFSVLLFTGEPRCSPIKPTQSLQPGLSLHDFAAKLFCGSEPAAGILARWRGGRGGG